MPSNRDNTLKPVFSFDRRGPGIAVVFSDRRAQIYNSNMYVTAVQT
jgi:hypothetical protein